MTNKSRPPLHKGKGAYKKSKPNPTLEEEEEKTSHVEGEEEESKHSVCAFCMDCEKISSAL
jgi:hypothetical protein